MDYEADFSAIHQQSFGDRFTRSGRRFHGVKWIMKLFGERSVLPLWFVFNAKTEADGSERSRAISFTSIFDD